MFIAGWLLCLTCATTLAADPTTKDAMDLLDKLKAKTNLTLNPKKGKGVLTMVDLSRKKVTDADLKTIAALPTVRDLNLEGVVDKQVNGKPVYAKMQITDEGLKNLSAMKGLQVLDLTGTNITDEGLKYLAAMKELKTLRLANTKVTDEGMEQLTKLPKLASVALDDTAVTDTGIFALKRWKSDLNISNSK
jgi:Leucine-rich repeat (LRR) protein